MFGVQGAALGQTYRIAATITITNAPTTNGQSITVNSSTRTWTNNPALNPAVYIQTNATKNGSATNLFQHVATYRFSSSINSLMTETNAIRIQGAIGGALTVTVAGEWASVTMSTQLVSTPFTVPVRVPLDIETATNATNIASMLFDGLNRLSTNRVFNSLVSTGATLANPTLLGTFSMMSFSNTMFQPTSTNRVDGDWSWTGATLTRLTNSSLDETNLAIGTNVFVRTTLTNVYTIRGIAGGRSGRMQLFYNPSGFGLSFTNESAAAPATSRILTLIGGNVTVTNGMALAMYDSTTNRWIVTGLGAASSAALFNGADLTNVTAYTSTAAGVPLTVQAAANQTANPFQVKDSAGAVLATVMTNGSIVSSNITASRLARWNGNKQLTNAADIYRQIFIPAGSMLTNLTEGALAAAEETSSNDRMFDYHAFSDTVTNGVQVVFAMPREWDVGTLKAKVFWSSTNAGANQTVMWEIAAGAVSNDDPIDATFGTAQTVSDDVTAANDLLLTSATAAITVGGTPAAEDLVWFRVRRLPSDASDDCGGLAKLLGLWIQYKEDQATEISSW